MSRRKKKKVKEPIPMKREEREKKIKDINMQLITADLFDKVNQYAKIGLKVWAEHGRDFVYTQPLYEMSRELVYTFYNDERKRHLNMIHVKVLKVTVEGEGDENIINKVNAMHTKDF